MSRKSQPYLRKRRSERFRSQKSTPRTEHVRLVSEFRALKAIAQIREPTQDEGRSLNSLAKRIRKLERKHPELASEVIDGPPEVDQKIPS